MKKIVIALLLLLVVSQLTYAQTPTTAKESSIEEAVLVHINQYRQHRGLTALTMDPHMVAEARKHSQDMATHRLAFGHTYFLERIKRLHSQIKNTGAGSENVAYNYKDGQDVVNNWLRSPGHKRNIDGAYDITGVGVARDARGKLYFTQIFLRKEGMPVRNGFIPGFRKSNS